MILKRAILLLCSQKPIELKSFYQALGVKFKTIKIDSQQGNFFRSNALWVLVNKTKGDAKTKLFLDSGATFLTVIDGNGEINNVIKKESPLIVQHLLNLKTEIAPNNDQMLITTVARVDNIESAKTSLNRFGAWIKEKHGSGPTHYCLAKNEITIELYNKRIIPLSTNHIELIIESRQFTIDTANLDVINKSKTSVTIKSPDGHIVTYLRLAQLKNSFIKSCS